MYKSLTPYLDFNNIIDVIFCKNVKFTIKLIIPELKQF